MGPTGSIDGSDSAFAISLNGQLKTPEDFGRVVIRSGDGTAVRLADIATVEPGVRNSRSDAWYDGKPAVLLNITKEANANVIATVDAVKALIPELQKVIPAGDPYCHPVRPNHHDPRQRQRHAMDATCDRAASSWRSSSFFCDERRRLWRPGVTVPLSLAGTFAAMWACGLSIDNLSLMALAVSVGFVVDDAIVMIENIYANLENRHEADEGRHRGRAADRLHGDLDQPVAAGGLHSRCSSSAASSGGSSRPSR